MWFAQISERTNVHGVASLLWFVKDVDPRRCHSCDNRPFGKVKMQIPAFGNGSLGDS